MRLDQMVSVLRSKNAGPLVLTFDLVFPDEDRFNHVAAAAEARGAAGAAPPRRYGEALEHVAVHIYRPALAIKISIPRKVMSGDPGDRDVYGAQQHVPLLGIEL